MGRGWLLGLAIAAAAVAAFALTRSDGPAPCHRGGHPVSEAEARRTVTRAYPRSTIVSCVALRGSEAMDRATRALTVHSDEPVYWFELAGQFTISDLPLQSRIVGSLWVVVSARNGWIAGSGPFITTQPTL